MWLTRLLRKAKPKVPIGVYSTTPFEFRTHNASHGGGYHIHLYSLDRGSYALTNIVFTRIDHEVYAYQHGEGKSKVTIPLSKLMTSSFKKRLINSGLKEEIKKNKRWTVLFSRKRVRVMTV
jgi:hypothetical protein